MVHYIVRRLIGGVPSAQVLCDLKKSWSDLPLDAHAIYQYQNSDMQDELLLVQQLDSGISCHEFIRLEKAMLAQNQIESPHFDITLSMVETTGASSPCADLNNVADPGLDRKYSIELIEALDLEAYKHLMQTVCGPTGRALFEDGFIDAIVCLELESVIEKKSHSPDSIFNQLHIGNCQTTTSIDDVNEQFGCKTKEILLKNNISESIFEKLDHIRKKQLWAWAKLLSRL